MHKILIVCDNCKCEESIDDINLIEETLLNGYVKTSFKCKECDHEFVVSILSKKGLMIREKLLLKQNEYKELVKDTGKFSMKKYKQAEKLRREVQRLSEELKKNMIVV